jgi:hypothetical protein
MPITVIDWKSGEADIHLLRGGCRSLLRDFLEFYPAGLFHCAPESPIAVPPWRGQSE